MTYARSLVAVMLLVAAGCEGPVVSSEHAHSRLVPPAVAGDAAVDARPAQPQSLPVPARVALAFVPEGKSGAPGASSDRPASWSSGPLPEAFKTQVLEVLAEAFRDKSVVAEVEVVPSFYLTGATAPDIVASVRATFDVDAVALVTYDLQHFQRVNGWACTYVLLVPYFFAPGNQIDSQLYLDAAVYWAQDGALLFRADGSAEGHARTAPPYLDEHVEQVTRGCFDGAIAALVPRLQHELDQFSRRMHGEPRVP